MEWRPNWNPCCGELDIRVLGKVKGFMYLVNQRDPPLKVTLDLEGDLTGFMRGAKICFNNPLLSGYYPSELDENAPLEQKGFLAKCMISEQVGSFASLDGFVVIGWFNIENTLVVVTIRIKDVRVLERNLKAKALTKQEQVEEEKKHERSLFRFIRKCGKDALSKEARGQ